MAKASTSLRLPFELLQELQAEAATKNLSANALLVELISDYFRQKRRAQIDGEFEQMATDEIYQLEASQIAKEFEAADWEAIR